MIDGNQTGHGKNDLSLEVESYLHHIRSKGPCEEKADNEQHQRTEDFAVSNQKTISTFSSGQACGFTFDHACQGDSNTCHHSLVGINLVRPASPTQVAQQIFLETPVPTQLNFVSPYSDAKELDSEDISINVKDGKKYTMPCQLRSSYHGPVIILVIGLTFAVLGSIPVLATQHWGVKGSATIIGAGFIGFGIMLILPALLWCAITFHRKSSPWCRMRNSSCDQSQSLRNDIEGKLHVEEVADQNQEDDNRSQDRFIV